MRNVPDFPRARRVRLLDGCSIGGNVIFAGRPRWQNVGRQ
jgi:hypothetical protein